jgi:hypothetical protein
MSVYKLGKELLTSDSSISVPVNSATLEHCLPCTVLISLLRQPSSSAGTLFQVGNGCCHVRLCNHQISSRQAGIRKCQVANDTAAAVWVVSATLLYCSTTITVAVLQGESSSRSGDTQGGVGQTYTHQAVITML